jgi:hypothetical protein
VSARSHCIARAWTTWNPDGSVFQIHQALKTLWLGEVSCLGCADYSRETLDAYRTCPHTRSDRGRVSLMRALFDKDLGFHYQVGVHK